MQPNIVTQEAWLAARRQLLAAEKELTRMHDRINAQRRALPWVRLDKTYVFDAPEGKVTLADLFDGRSQLVVKHFMFGPDWDEGCVGCSFGADHVAGALVHLEHHDVSFVSVSRAPLPKIEAFRKRMDWGFRWVSSYGNDFNADFHVSFTADDRAKGKVFYNFALQDFQSEEMPGMSVFCKDADGNIFHTYSQYARGGEAALSTYAILDITPNGRNETINGNLTDWVRHHDKYDGGETESCCH
jgi:predicted dithiol-disulfide oxidoreductase (DUF899 family)